ncbi:MAG: TIGR02186 family protein [Paracoccaceae bacterium]
MTRRGALRALGRALLALALAVPGAAAGQGEREGPSPLAPEGAEAAIEGERVLARLSQTNVAITTGFTGSEIFIYGAIRREAPAPEGPLDVIVALTGPSRPVTIRQKERVFGIWVNGPGVEIDAAPSFYAVASTRPLDEILSYTDDLRHRIRLDSAIRLIDAPDWLGAERDTYRAALARLRRDDGLYNEHPRGVTLIEGTLFETRVALPADVTEGAYEARVFLMRERAVIDHDRTTIEVRKVGLERLIDAFARESAVLYGLASVAVALAAGWGASALVRWLAP